MSNDPLSMFGGLMRRCIREDRLEDGKILTEGVLLMILGVASSFVTTYVLAWLGFLV
jgi:heme O synthase-like polyprenyltransferase